MSLTDYSAKRVQWPTQETATDWVPTGDNTAGWFDLGTDGALVCGATTRGSTLLWTTKDLWQFTYIGGLALYRADRVGDNCGIIAPNAKVVVDSGAYWMGFSGFFVFDGFAKPLPCEVQDYVFGSLNRTYQHRVWALSNPAFGEVTWFYPSASATTCDRYVTYSYRENHWVTGTLSRSIGVTSAIGGTVPVMFDASGNMYTHETGTGRNSEGTPSLESGPFEIEDGDNTAAIQKVIPDDKTVGDVNLTIYTSMYPDENETTHGPYTLTKLTSVRLKARQARIKLTEAVANAWRVGVIRLGVVPSSRR